jgi:hypothetical protein
MSAATPETCGDAIEVPSKVIDALITADNAARLAGEA